MRTPSRALPAATTTLLATTLVLVAPTVAQAAPSPAGPPGDDHQHQTVDNRHGLIAPTGRQRALAAAAGASARWNAFGTPAALTAATPLATGLPPDPVAAARAYIDANRDVLGLTARGADSLDLLTSAPLGAGAAVLFRQRFGDLPAGHDGLLALGVRDGQIWYVSSSLARDAEAPAPATLPPADAQRVAAVDAGLANPTVLANRLVAVPTADRGARAAYQVTLGSGLTGADPVAYTSYVDARDGGVLLRENIVDSDKDNGEWSAFPSSPPTDYSSRDTRQTWCFEPSRRCDYVIGTASSPYAWDVVNGASTRTTAGNNAVAVQNWNSNDPFSVGTETATPRPDRRYDYRWTNQWQQAQCSPAVFDTAQRNDIDAARANLFALHNRMHDWAYQLGFTEQTFNMQDDNYGRGGLGADHEQGNAQAGGISGGPPDFAARDNANQITPPDGQAPITNMYLWQPIAGSFYAPCVDGDFDMSVVGHEYTHAITNRMIAGPDAGLSSPQGMSESWSDQMAMEYLNENGYAPRGSRAYTIGQYVTGDPKAGIRNYNMSASPLNYSAIDYDFVGLQVHASGEVWSATNFDIRAAMIKRYGAGTPALQKACAAGRVAVTSCPGNRRWAQLVFDSFLLMANSANSMVDARDALLGADLVRFGGANQALLWNAFAKRGLGESAVSNGAADVNPTPSFVSPYAPSSVVTFRPVDEHGQAVPNAKLFVGDYQARAVAVADTDPSTALPDTVRLVPGTYTFIAQAPGYGEARVRATSLRAGPARLRVRMPVNLASGNGGATVTGDGINLARLVDDDEATNWASLAGAVAGKQVTVDLAGGVQKIRRVQVSAMLRPAIATDPDGAAQSRFSALRQFRVLACTASATVACADAAEFRPVYTSRADAFPSVAPRPRAPELIVRSFPIPPTYATHLRFEVLTNQCTGGPDYAGEQDADPRAATDCGTASAQALNVRVAEFQAFGS
ncbi:M36 family metallopeptidase [Actinoplanes sp. KI2]|uniref:M36 family metallopeptidase n=1 Tax=Actinoplanes sp. KI2 TaxID=2983315 RepID=UPI0021D5BCB8|nr:M36 family metallopeptidase [Actinoplanes sp. KI2]MCU7726372.1 M36 family metallopeptidase [Actinoplanes sp. KI2]